MSAHCPHGRVIYCALCAARITELEDKLLRRYDDDAIPAQKDSGRIEWTCDKCGRVRDGGYLWACTKGGYCTAHAPREAQPVAWRETNGDTKDGWNYYDADSNTGRHIASHQKSRHGIDVFPLYAAPREAQQPAKPFNKEWGIEVAADRIATLSLQVQTLERELKKLKEQY